MSLCIITKNFLNSYKIPAAKVWRRNIREEWILHILNQTVQNRYLNNWIRNNFHYVENVDSYKKIFLKYVKIKIKKYWPIDLFM